MASVRTNVIALETMIAAPIRAVFELLRTPARRPEWMTNLHEVRNVTGQGLDDSWEYTYTMLGRPFTGKIAFRELEAPRSMKLEVTGGTEGMQEWLLTTMPDGSIPVCPGVSPKPMPASLVHFRHKRLIGDRRPDVIGMLLAGREVDRLRR